MSLGMDSINALACPFTITALSTVQTPHLADLWQVSQSPRCEVFRRSILNPGRARHQGRERESELKSTSLLFHALCTVEKGITRQSCTNRSKLLLRESGNAL